MNELASSFLSGSLTLTDDHGFVLDEFQFAEAGRVDEENVLLYVDPVGLVDVAKHVHSGGKKNWGMFLGLPDPDTIVRGMDPDPSIIK